MQLLNSEKKNDKYADVARNNWR